MGNICLIRPIRSLVLRQAIFGEQHISVAIGKGLLCSLRLDQARYAEALELSRDTLAMFEALDYQSARNRIAIITRKARALAGLGEYTTAQEAFGQAFELAEQAGENAGNSRTELETAWASFRQMP